MKIHAPVPGIERWVLDSFACFPAHLRERIESSPVQVHFLLAHNSYSDHRHQYHQLESDPHAKLYGLFDPEPNPPLLLLRDPRADHVMCTTRHEASHLVDHLLFTGNGKSPYWSEHDEQWLAIFRAAKQRGRGVSEYSLQSEAEMFAELLAYLVSPDPTEVRKAERRMPDACKYLRARILSPQ